MRSVVSSRPTSVAAVQLLAHDRADFAERWPALLARIAAAATAGARLIVVPEGTVPAYLIGMQPVDPHLLEAAAEDVIRVAARSGATIVYGGARPQDGGLANSAYVVTPAGIAGFADKCFLWHFDRRWFSAGSSLEPVDTPAGRLGVFVCADGRIPTIASALVERGAEALVMPTAWVSSGRDPAVRENLQADLMIPVRARENGVPLVAANKVGVEARSVLYCGKSQLVAADGTVVALASQDKEETVTGTLDFAAVTAPPRMGDATAIVRQQGPPLADLTRIAISAHSDPRLHALAMLADAEMTIDPHAIPASADVALAGDDAVLDPRALVEPRLNGVCLFVWRTAAPERWIVPFARTRAAELRCYMVVLDDDRKRAYAVDPDGAVLAGTTVDGFELAAFSFDRRRTQTWTVAPHTNVRAGLERVAGLGQAAAR